MGNLIFRDQYKGSERMEKQLVTLVNVELDADSYKINDYISLEKDRNKNTRTIIAISDDDNGKRFESNGLLFYEALRLALPEVNIRVKRCITLPGDDSLFEVLREFNTPLLNYPVVKDDNFDIYETHAVLTLEKIERLKYIHGIVIDAHRKAFEERKTGSFEQTRWRYAYDQYISACSNALLDNSIMHLITGLESLLVKGDTLLSHKLSLHASLLLKNDINERKEIYNFLKNIYNVRSKAVHGEIKELAKLLSKSDIYDKYFKLKTIFVEILLKTYGLDEEYIFSRLDEIVFMAPSFDE
jgi:hypothetical protein